MQRKLQQLTDSVKKAINKSSQKNTRQVEAVELGRIQRAHDDDESDEYTVFGGEDSHQESSSDEIFKDFVMVHTQEDKPKSPISSPEKSKQQLMKTQLTIVSREENLKTKSQHLGELDQLDQTVKTPAQHVVTENELRTNYLNFLIMMSVHFARRDSNSKSESNFQKLGFDILCTVIHHFDFASMKTNQEHGVELARSILYSSKKILEKLDDEVGQINIFQRDGEFTLFKSIRILAKDREKNQSKYSRNGAIDCWEQHSSLFEKPKSKQKLLDDIKGTLTHNNIALFIRQQRRW